MFFLFRVKFHLKVRLESELNSQSLIPSPTIQMIIIFLEVLRHYYNFYSQGKGWYKYFSNI